MKLKLDTRYLKIAAGFMTLSVILLVIFFVLISLDNKKVVTDDDTDVKQRIEYNGTYYVPRKNMETFLFIGLDTFDMSDSGNSYNNTQQADFLLLFAIDKKNKVCYPIQLNRDTMADITVLGVTGKEVSTVREQLALAHTYGSGGKDSCKNTAKAVSALLGDIKVDHYMSLTMDAVGILNDAVGGVTVKVKDDLTSLDPALVQGSEVKLNANQALLYVRSRKGVADQTNINRMERQKQYIDALFSKLGKSNKTDNDFVVDSLTEVSQYMVSDCSIEQLSTLFDRIETYEMAQTVIPDGVAVSGKEYMEFNVDQDALSALVIDIFYQPEK